VAMLLVVPREEVLAVHARRLDRGEPTREAGPVLQRLELRLTVIRNSYLGSRDQRP